ncbi:MAG: hypothetical protein PHF86_00825 [Candidatus Nanoarchaeia archaeon]|nr:hypothetical protein [Candidatus Nanoarchaeia archaeon]
MKNTLIVRAKTINETIKYNWGKDKVAGKKIIPNRFVYHISIPEFRKEIYEKGLIAKVGESYSGWAQDKDKIISAIFATNSFEEAIKNLTPEIIDCWEIDTFKIDNEWFIDKHFENFSKNPHIVTFENIPIEAIKIIKF